MKLQNKLSLALGFQFIIILLFGILGIASIKRLSNQSGNILKNNYETLVYCNNMLESLENIPEQKDALKTFEASLQNQEKNITEPGEADATRLLRSHFEQLKARGNDPADYKAIRSGLRQINNINQVAILAKNKATQETAHQAVVWLTIIFSILTIVAFTLTINFPGIIATPVKALSEGIKAIAGKQYQQRIYLKQKDEFGDLADAFNTMAEKLDEFENSNLARVKFEKSRIETIINQMKDGIIGLDENRNILFTNAVAEKILGLSEASILGRYAPDVAVNNDLMRTLLQEKDQQELKIFADGKESFFNQDVFHVTNNGQRIGQVIVLRNITPYHELNEAKTNFIATVSHELKTPIAAIRLSLQLLNNQQTGKLNEEQQLLLGSIGEDTNRLLNITGELLDMTQVESGKIQLNIKPTEPSSFIQYALNANKTAAEQKKIHIDLQLPPGTPQVLADEEKTAWVLTNLLSNAIRYSYENSTVFLSIEVNDRQFKLTVRDTGKGIEPAYQDKIFDRYFKVPGSSKEGTGLGLAICKEFMEAQHGTISAESEYGAGSSFSITLQIV